MTKITLNKPITIGPTGDKANPPIVIGELSFREEVCAGDLRDMPLGALVDPSTMPLGKLLIVAGRLCGHPEAVMNKLSFFDVQEVAAKVVGFMMVGQETGTEPSP